VARAGGYYRKARYLLVTIMIVLGLWFAYDGWINWPAEQQRFAAMSPREQSETKKPHTNADILLQKALALFLVPGGPLLLAWFLYRSRGECRLADNTLYVPGHPPVPLENVRELDMALWERKGIAVVVYELPANQRSAKLKLDDFVYQRDPIDSIVKRIKNHLSPASPETATEESA
jgi:hypothetical protein